MKLSIIVPVFNGQETIVKALDSVAPQVIMHADCECIVVNDGSTDGTETIISRYCSSHDRFRFVRQENAGLILARRKGVSCAYGEYCAFLDADDTLTADSVDVILSALMEFNNPDMLIFNLTNPHTGTPREPIFPDCKLFSGGELILFREAFMRLGMINMVRKVVRRNILLEDTTDYRSYSRVIGEDLLTSFWIVDKARSVGYINNCLYQYRFVGASMSLIPVTVNTFNRHVSSALPSLYFYYYDKWTIVDPPKSYGWRWFYVRLFDAFCRMLINESWRHVRNFLQTNTLLDNVCDPNGLHLLDSNLRCDQRRLLNKANQKRFCFIWLYRFWLRLHWRIRGLIKR